MERPSCLSTFSNLMGLKFQTLPLSAGKKQNYLLSFFTLQLWFSLEFFGDLQKRKKPHTHVKFGDQVRIWESLRDIFQLFLLFLCLFYYFFLQFPATVAIPNTFSFVTPQAKRISTVCPSSSHPRYGIWEVLVGKKI